MKLHEQFLAARRAGTPLIAIKTFDPEATIAALQSLMANMNGLNVTPLIQHDIVRGLLARNDEGQGALDKMFEGGGNIVNPIDMLIGIEKLPFDPDARHAVNPIVYVLNGHSYLDRSYGERQPFIQALWNLRIPFRDSGRTVVLLGPEFDFPAELQHDVLILDEPLPTEKELTQIITETCDAFGGLTIDPEVMRTSVDATRGLVRFEAEQAVAMCITKAGLNVDELWLRKKQMISSTKGLSVWLGGQKFDDLGELDEIKARFRRILKGKRPPRVIVWIDEIEKTGLGTAGGDLSGTSSDQLGIILGEMQDKEYTGALFVGIPGSAKSAFAKAIANEAGCITIKLDLGGAKGEGLVGQAENDIRNAFKIIEAVGGFGGAFVIATSNDIRVVKPELKRRFKKGIWFFDFLTKEGRQLVWQIYLSKYPEVADLYEHEICESDFPDDSDWTGAEIETCVSTAWEEGLTLKEAARSIIPVAVSGKEDMTRLRQEAAGRYNSTNYPGVYQTPAPGTQALAKSSSRKFARGGE